MQEIAVKLYLPVAVAKFVPRVSEIIWC